MRGNSCHERAGRGSVDDDGLPFRDRDDGRQRTNARTCGRDGERHAKCEPVRAAEHDGGRVARQFAGHRSARDV